MFETAQPSSPRRNGLSLFALAVFLVLSGAVAAAGGFISARSLHTWYPTLVRPSFTPPNWLFAPVWAILYILMAVAAWIVWRATRKSRRDIAANLSRQAARKDALVVYTLQLALNLAWVFAFFYLHRMLVAVAFILLLWMAILSTTILFWRIRQLAGALLLPYLAWVSFTTALNLVFLRLN